MWPTMGEGLWTSIRTGLQVWLHTQMSVIGDTLPWKSAIICMFLKSTWILIWYWNFIFISDNKANNINFNIGPYVSTSFTEFSVWVKIVRFESPDKRGTYVATVHINPFLSMKVKWINTIKEIGCITYIKIWAINLESMKIKIKMKWSSLKD